MCIFVAHGQLNRTNSFSGKALPPKRLGIFYFLPKFADYNTDVAYHALTRMASIK
jgi:hypothetical protein